MILAKTIKGWTLGPEIEARNATHQIKKMTKAQLLALRDRLYLNEEIPDEALGGHGDAWQAARIRENPSLANGSTAESIIGESVCSDCAAFRRSFRRLFGDQGAHALEYRSRLSLGGLARVQITMFGARLKADWVVKHLLMGRDLVSEPRCSGLDPVRRL